MNNVWDGAEVICTYTRAQAIEDGVLVDMTTWAAQAGFKFPVAFTSGVYDECVAVREGMEGQDSFGRAWDIFTMLRHAIKTAKPGSSTVYLKVLVQNERGQTCQKTLKSVCGPGDSPDPVITIMFPEED